jgi:hypothetical protein
MDGLDVITELEMPREWTPTQIKEFMDQLDRRMRTGSPVPKSPFVIDVTPDQFGWALMAALFVAAAVFGWWLGA